MNTQGKKETISREIAKNIFLHTSKMALKNTDDLAHTLYTYTVDVKEISLVDITLDFTGGENIKIENQDGFVARGIVKPMSSQVIAVIRAFDITWSTPCKIKMSKRSPTIEDQELFIKGDLDQLKIDIEKARGNWSKFPLKVSTHEEIRSQLRTTGTSYIDIEFTPEDRSIFDPSKGQGFDRKVHWRRPRDFMVADPSKGLYDPVVFDKSIEPSDILQGQLGDCWLLCAIACLAEMPSLIERLFLVKEYNDEGIYRVKICKNGEWCEVVVDDYFPCFPNGQPIFSKGNGNELWVLILEKAYAKLHGCYKNIVGGSPYEAMMDLTGCPTTSFSFQDENVQDMVKSGKLWSMLKRYDQEGYVMSGGTPGEDMFTESGKSVQQTGGLVPGHAYSIISAIEAANTKLLMIRNPWGQFEWDGDWSDKSDKWTPEMIRAFNPVLDGDDGTFWMSFDDFVSHFDSLDVCRVSNWDELRIRGRFIRYNDVADPQNEVVVSKWFYALEIPTRTHLVVGLHQEDERLEGTLPRRPYQDFGLAIIKRSPEGSSLLHMKDYVMARDCEIECVLEPGSYIVVPRTTGCAMKRPQDADEQERVNGLFQADSIPTELMEATISDIFKKFDLVISNTIDYKEFVGLYEIIGKKITELEFKSAIVGKYVSRNGELTYKGFRDWFIDQIKKEGEEKIFEWLNKLGYDKDLYSVRSRLFTVTFHSKNLAGGDEKMEVKIRDAIGTDIDNVATKLILEAHGKDIERGEGYRIVQFESPSVFSWTFGVVNDSDHPMNVNLDLSKSDNVMVSTKVPLAKRRIESRQCAFLMHAQAGFGAFNKTIDHEVEHLPRKK